MLISELRLARRREKLVCVLLADRQAGSLIEGTTMLALDGINMNDPHLQSAFGWTDSSFLWH